MACDLLHMRIHSNFKPHLRLAQNMPCTKCPPFYVTCSSICCIENAPVCGIRYSPVCIEGTRYSPVYIEGIRCAPVWPVCHKVCFQAGFSGSRLRVGILDTVLKIWQRGCISFYCLSFVCLHKFFLLHK